MEGLLFALTLAAALGCGLVAGVFFAFSSFVMRGLDLLEPPRAVSAMQAINVAAVSPAFMFALFGTAVACLALAVWGLAEWHERFAPFVLAGGVLYLVGVVVLTIAFHVPRNDALAKVEPGGADAPSEWTRYLSQWTAANHVRALTALGAAGAFTVALAVG